MGIQSLTSGLDVKEGAEPNYAVYLLRGEVLVKDMYLISTTNGRMFTNIAESIIGVPAIRPGGHPTGGRCERHAAHAHGTLIGRLVLACSLMSTFGVILCSQLFWGSLPAALEPTAALSAYISTAIDRLTGPRNDVSKLNDPFSTGSIFPCRLESFC